MQKPAPPIDGRTGADIIAQTQGLLKVYAPNWGQIDPQTGRAVGVSAALLGIFGHLASLVIQRLNQAPDKNFLAFLDMLGASRLPPEPARVPLTFFLAAGSPTDAIIPPETLVAAPPDEGETEPVIFETERELVVTAAQLTWLLARDPHTDLYADWSAILAHPSGQGVPAFQGTTPLDHIFYVRSELFGTPGVNRADLTLDLDSTFAVPPELSWEFWDGAHWVAIVPQSDGTQKLTVKGQGTLTFDPLPVIAPFSVNKVAGYWLRCRLNSPIVPATQAGTVRADQLPTLNSISLSARFGATGIVPDAAFTNLAAADLSQGLNPFGLKPRFGDTLYLASGEAFSQPGAQVTVNVVLNDPAKVGIPDPRKAASDNLTLNWEYWDGSTWALLGVTGIKVGVTPGFKDTTNAFTQSGAVTFQLPRNLPVTVNGLSDYWIRVRLTGGNYGVEAQYLPIDPASLEKGYRFVPATFAPPSVARVTIDYTVSRSNVSPDTIFSYNDFDYQTPVFPFDPFRPTDDPSPSLYLGFTLPAGRATFPNITTSLYLQLADVLYGQPADNPSAATPPHVLWEYRNGSGRGKLLVEDETASLVHSGLVRFLAPDDFAQSTEFGRTSYWLCLRWDSGDYAFMPRMRTVLLNTTTAAQTRTLRGEILGSSNGSAGQVFKTVRAPVLAGQQLQVREPELPGSIELAALEQEEGMDAVSVMPDPVGQGLEIWVRWHPVPDFYGSSPRDRHYVLDPLTGEVRFGDGLNGHVPPVGVGNIRMASYRTGGGARGNRAPGAIVQLKTTLPYIDRVINVEAATGGAEAETLDSLITRAPRNIRHRNRAVTVEDYEDLAILASPEVARARCVPLYDLAADPDALHQVPGAVSIIIAPRSINPRPQVTLGLLELVQTFLEAHSIPTATLVVVGPDYVRIDILVEIALARLDLATQVESAAAAALAAFLHPITGGLDGNGWDFGRQPHQSDIFALLEAIPGVDHIRTLAVAAHADRSGADQTARFLIYPGQLKIELVFEEI